MTYPPPPPPAVPNRPARLRGHTGIRVGGILSLVGLGLLIAGIVVLATGSLGKVNNFQRVRVADQTGTVHFSHTGGYVAYYEASGVNDSDNQRIPLVRVQLTGPSGQPMTLSTLYGGNSTTIKKLTYDYNGHHGAALYQFHIAQTGMYQVQLAALNVPSDATIAFGTSIATGTFLGAGLTGAGVLVLIAGLIVLIVGMVRRRNHKNQLLAGAGYPMGTPPPPGYPQGGYPPPYQGYPPPGAQPGPPPGAPSGPPPPAYPPAGYSPQQQSWQPPPSLEKSQPPEQQQSQPWPPKDDE